MAELDRRLEDFQKLCRRRGLPLTVQRRVVLEALLGRKDHPTADQIFQEVREKLPGISRTTVYRVLETLVRFGLARKAAHPGASTRFDPITGTHHHLLCTRCQKVIDFPLEFQPSLSLPQEPVEGFRIEDYSIYFEGICSECQKECS